MIEFELKGKRPLSRTTQMQNAQLIYLEAFFSRSSNCCFCFANCSLRAAICSAWCFLMKKSSCAFSLLVKESPEPSVLGAPVAPSVYALTETILLGTAVRALLANIVFVCVSVYVLLLLSQTPRMSQRPRSTPSPHSHLLCLVALLEIGDPPLSRLSPLQKTENDAIGGWQRPGMSGGDASRECRQLPVTGDSSGNSRRSYTQASSATVPTTATAMADTNDVRLDAHSGAVFTARFNEDGAFVASGGVDKCIRIWNLEQLDADVGTSAEAEVNEEETTEGVYDEKVANSAVTSLQWSNIEDSYIYFSSADRTAAIFDLNKSSKVKTLHHPSTVNQLSLSKNDTIVTCCDDGKVRVWDKNSKFPVGTIQSPLQLPILTTCIDADCNRVYFSGIDPTIYCYDLRKLDAPIWSEGQSHTNNVTSVSLSPDESYLLSRSIDGTIKYFDSRILPDDIVSTKKRAKPYVFEGSSASEDDWLIRAIVIPDPTNESDDLFNVVSGSNDGFTYVWEFASRKLINRLDGHLSTVLDVDYSEINNQLLTSSADGSIILRSLELRDEL